MKKMTRLLAVCMAMVLVFGSAVTVFAAPSTDTTTATTGETDVTATAPDVSVTVNMKGITESSYTSAKSAAESLGLVGAYVRSVFNLDGTLTGKTKITMSVPGIEAGMKVAVLHFKNGKWVREKVTDISAGKVTAEFDSLSPVAIVVYNSEAPKKTDDTKTDSATSPKTGEEFPIAGAISLLALCTAAVCFKKYAK